MTYTIRTAKPSDVPAFAQIEINAGELFKTVSLDSLAGDHSSPEFVMSFVKTGGAFAAVQDEGSIVGFALAFALDKAIHLQEMSVDPMHGRQGLGGRLLQAVAAWAGEHDFTHVTLSTFDDVAWNAPFYKRHGYEIVERPNWTPGLHILREHEAHAGLPVARRCFMRKSIE